MVDIDSRVYEVLPGPPSSTWTSMYNGGNKSRSKTVGPPSRSMSVPGGGHYAVPRGVNATPPLPRSNPPSVPPRNRHTSEGEHPLPGSLGSSPNDRAFWGSNGRVKTPTSGIRKSPSILSVGSTISNPAVEELSLTDFMMKYSKSLPHRVKVCKGFYGVSEQTAVTTGDVLNLHFLKKTKVVLIETLPTDGSVTYSVPITSSLQFSLLYDPNDNISEAKKGFKFDTAGDVLAMKTLPKLLRVTRSFQGNSSDNSVTEGELLVVKGAKSKITGKQLKVYSITSTRKKILSENCAGHFTTDTSKLKQYLFEISMNMPEALPHKAVISTNCGALRDLSGTVVTLKKAISETSVVATSALEDAEDGEQPDVAEMPAELDIEVEAVPLDENEIEQLRHDTKYMYENFDPMSCCLYLSKSIKRHYDIQNDLYKNLLNPGTEFRGLEVLRPSTISNTPSRLPVPPSPSGGPPGGMQQHQQVYQPLNSNGVDRPSTCTDYYVLMTPRGVAKEASDSSDQSGESAMSDKDHLSLLETHNKHIEKKLSRAFDEITKLTSKVEHLRRFTESLQNQLRMVQSERVSESSAPSVSPPPIDNRPPAPLPAEARMEPEYELGGTYHVISTSHSSSRSSLTESGSSSSQPSMTNDEFLMSMNHQQVLKLLDKMSLEMYKEAFKREQISGEILSECDEDVLINDLGMKSKLHRMRILKVISGRHSAQSILAGEGPYAKKKPSPEITEHSNH